MSELQLALCLLCFWPFVAIGWPFLIWVRNERLLRFSLRSLLVTTTAIAAVLGMAVYTLRK